MEEGKEVNMLLNRQDDLNNIITDALKNPDLKEALQAFNMGQNEYFHAISGLKTVRFYSGNTTNIGEKENAKLENH